MTGSAAGSSWTRPWPGAQKSRLVILLSRRPASTPPSHLGVRAGQPGTPAAWDAELAQCSRSFGRGGEFNHYSGLPRVAVLGVRVQDAADPRSGISGTAKATVRYERAGKSRRIRWLPARLGLT